MTKTKENMKLITKDILNKTPALSGKTRSLGAQVKFTARFVNSNQPHMISWCLAEYNPVTGTAWGMIDEYTTTEGFTIRWDYFSIPALESGTYGLVKRISLNS